MLLPHPLRAPRARRLLRARALLATVGGLVTLTATGCGGPSSVVPPGPPPKLPPPLKLPSPASKTTTTTATTTTTTATTTTGTVTTVTTGTTTTTAIKPPVPNGLKAATGYGSYDDCKGTCTGSVPASLFRPLDLPTLGSSTTCPVTPAANVLGYTAPAVGKGPIYAGQGTPLAIGGFVNSAWAGARVTWLETGSYTGPVLIRGGQLGGAESVGFGEGHVPVDDLQLLTPVSTFAGVRQWPSFTRVQGPGCYAYQVDGTKFTEVIVFQATE